MDVNIAGRSSVKSLVFNVCVSSILVVMAAKVSHLNLRHITIIFISNYGRCKRKLPFFNSLRR